MNRYILAGLAAAVAFTGTVSPAVARTGGGVSAGHDITITVRQKGAQTAVAIGQDAHARNVAGAVVGDVEAGHDITITVEQEKASTAVAIGQNVSAANVAGVVSSVSPF